MKHLALPGFGAETVIDALGTGPRIDKVTAAADLILEREREYLKHAEERTWWEMIPGSGTGDKELDDDIRYAYESKLGNPSGSARLLYNSLRSSSKPHNRCPLCLERDVAALDHYLPKEEWPLLAVVPANLYPICTTCNHTKRAQYAMTPDAQFLHPYFDDLEQEPWVAVELTESPGAPLAFYASPPSHWDDLTSARTIKHFERFGLANLFRDHAATLLAGYVVRLRDLLDKEGPDGVRLEFSGLAVSRTSATIDLWSGIALKTWADSDWFCEGGWEV